MESTSSHGFPAVAAFLSRDEDHETYVFRKFNNLAARNLVHLQNDLMALESQLEALDRKSKEGTDLELKLSLRDWEEFKVMAQQQARDEYKLKQLTAEIDAKLDRYHNALLQMSSVATLQRPRKRVVDAFREEFEHMDISGHSANILRDVNDLIALRPSPDSDLLSHLVREHWPFPTKRLANSYYDQAEHFQEGILQLVVSLISVAVAAVLLAGSIIALYFVHKPDLRLGLLILFILLFAIGIRICTSTSGDSIFAATAAYSAVLVVFVSGNLGNAQPG